VLPLRLLFLLASCNVFIRREKLKQHILIVEDEIKIAELLKDYINAADYDCTLLHNGDEVNPWLALNQSDLILLDLMLPGTDGLSLCRTIRKNSDVPIIIITARVEEIDRLLGLELGADDYICKPFSPKEVVARIKAILRRSQNNKEVIPNGLHLDIDCCQLSLNNQVIILTAVESKLIHLLMEKPGRIYSRDVLMENIYNDNRIVSHRTIDSHVKKLRNKIRVLIPEGELIQSVYGVGYKLDFSLNNYCPRLKSKINRNT